MKLKAKNIIYQSATWIKGHWILSIIIVIGLLFASYYLYQRTLTEEEELTFIHPQRENLIKTLDVSGLVDADEKARLRFVVGGKVVYVGAQEGDVVKKWQTIATIDQATLNKQLQQDLNNYMKERWDWEETRDDIEYRTLDTTERRSVDKEQWDLENQVLNVEIRDIAIKNTVLSAPFDGVLTVSPTAVAGVQLLASDYFEIVNPESLQFIAEVDEADIAMVKPGQEATITLDAYPDQEYNTYVDYVAYTSSQSTSGTVFRVKLPLNHLGGIELFRLGMNGDISIFLDERTDVITVPIIATKTRDGKILVDVKQPDGSTTEQEIQVGLETDEKYEVLGGITEADEILLPE